MCSDTCFVATPPEMLKLPAGVEPWMGRAESFGRGRGWRERLEGRGWRAEVGGQRLEGRAWEGWKTEPDIQKIGGQKGRVDF